MAGRLAGKVAVITGAASGIGAATAHRFAQEGARLVLSDQNAEGGKKIADQLGAEAFAEADVSKPEQVEAVMQTAAEACGGVHIVFNNAGIGAYGKAPDLDVETWKQVVAVDLDAVFYGCKFAIPHLRAAGGGAIINTASISGLFADFGLVAYNAAKAGVVNLTRTVAVDHAAEGIRVNCVCPGPIETALLQPLLEVRGAAAEYRQRIPMGRIGKAEEVAAAVAFLASDDASYITGAALTIDGGLTAATGQPNLTRLIET